MMKKQLENEKSGNERPINHLGTILVITWEAEDIPQMLDASGLIIKSSFYLTVNFAKRCR